MLKPPRGSRNQTVLRISLVCLFCLVVLVSLVSWLSVVCSVSLKRAAKEEQEAPEKTRMRSTNGRRLENYKKYFLVQMKILFSIESCAHVSVRRHGERHGETRVV